MLVDGFNHVAILTKDTDRLHRFYAEIFDATNAPVEGTADGPFRMTVIDVGKGRELNVFEIADKFRAEDALVQVGSASELGDAVLGLLTDEPRRRALGEKARRLVDTNRGALRGTLDGLHGIVA